MNGAGLIAVLLAGSAGAVLRYVVTQLFARPDSRLPWAVLVVNVAGSLLGGVLLGLADLEEIAPAVRTMLFTGLAGGLTTYSTFAVETMQLTEERRFGTAAVSVLANLVLGLVAAVAGVAAVHLLFG